VAVATLTRTGTAGANRFGFTGRIGRGALKAGGYRATTTATDAAGNKSRVARAKFTIVGR
jgi:hypothetical protein